MKLTSNPNQSTLRTPGQTTRSTTRSGARIARVIALSGVVAVLACGDSTSPQRAKPVPEAPAVPAPPAAAPSTPLGMLGASLDDATSMFVPTMQDPEKRAQLQAVIKDLSEHLMAANIDLSTKDLAAGRALIASVEEVQQIELGAIGIAFDQIELALSQASN